MTVPEVPTTMSSDAMTQAFHDLADQPNGGHHIAPTRDEPEPSHDGPRIEDMDPNLITTLRGLADNYGALGVAKAAALLTAPRFGASLGPSLAEFAAPYRQRITQDGDTIQSLRKRLAYAQTEASDLKDRLDATLGGLLGAGMKHISERDHARDLAARLWDELAQAEQRPFAPGGVITSPVDRDSPPQTFGPPRDTYAT